MEGGGQEGNRRSGTENVAAIAGFGQAIAYQLAEEAEAREERLRGHWHFFEKQLSELIPSRIIFSEGAARAPGITYLAIPDAAPQLIRRIHGVVVSPGSSCASLKATPSEALLAMGVSNEPAANAVRVSLSHLHSTDEITTIAQAIAAAQSG